MRLGSGCDYVVRAVAVAVHEDRCGRDDYGDGDVSAVWNVATVSLCVDVDVINSQCWSSRDNLLHS